MEEKYPNVTFNFLKGDKERYGEKAQAVIEALENRIGKDTVQALRITFASMDGVNRVRLYESEVGTYLKIVPIRGAINEIVDDCCETIKEMKRATRPVASLANADFFSEPRVILASTPSEIPPPLTVAGVGSEKLPEKREKLIGQLKDALIILNGFIVRDTDEYGYVSMTIREVNASIAKLQRMIDDPAVFQEAEKQMEFIVEYIDAVEKRLNEKKSEEPKVISAVIEKPTPMPEESSLAQNPSPETSKESKEDLLNARWNKVTTSIDELKGQYRNITILFSGTLIDEPYVEYGEKAIKIVKRLETTIGVDALRSMPVYFRESGKMPVAVDQDFGRELMIEVNANLGTVEELAEKIARTIQEVKQPDASVTPAVPEATPVELSYEDPLSGLTDKQKEARRALGVVTGTSASILIPEAMKEVFTVEERSFWDDYAKRNFSGGIISPAERKRFEYLAVRLGLKPTEGESIELERIKSNKKPPQQSEKPEPPVVALSSEKQATKEVNWELFKKQISDALTVDKLIEIIRSVDNIRRSSGKEVSSQVMASAIEEVRGSLKELAKEGGTMTRKGLDMTFVEKNVTSEFGIRGKAIDLLLAEFEAIKTTIPEAVINNESSGEGSPTATREPTSPEIPRTPKTEHPAEKPKEPAPMTVAEESAIGSSPETSSDGAAEKLKKEFPDSDFYFDPDLSASRAAFSSENIAGAIKAVGQDKLGGFRFVVKDSPQYSMYVFVSKTFICEYLLSETELIQLIEDALHTEANPVTPDKLRAEFPNIGFDFVDFDPNLDERRLHEASRDFEGAIKAIGIDRLKGYRFRVSASDGINFEYFPDSKEFSFSYLITESGIKYYVNPVLDVEAKKAAGFAPAPAVVDSERSSKGSEGKSVEQMERELDEAGEKLIAAATTLEELYANLRAIGSIKGDDGMLHTAEKLITSIIGLQEIRRRINEGRIKSEKAYVTGLDWVPDTYHLRKKVDELIRSEQSVEQPAPVPLPINVELQKSAETKVEKEGREKREALTASLRDIITTLEEFKTKHGDDDGHFAKAIKAADKGIARLELISGSGRADQVTYAEVEAVKNKLLFSIEEVRVFFNESSETEEEAEVLAQPEGGSVVENPIPLPIDIEPKQPVVPGDAHEAPAGSSVAEKVSQEGKSGKGKERTREDAESEVMASFERHFGVGVEDLRKIPEFQDLSLEQKALVLQNLEQIVLQQVHVEGLKRARKGKAEAGIAGRLWRGLFSRYYNAAAEKGAAGETVAGGVGQYRKLIETLAKQVYDGGVEVAMKDNNPRKLELWYATTAMVEAANKTPEQRSALEVFEAAARAFITMRPEWKYGTSKKNKENFEKVQKEYQTARGQLMALVPDAAVEIPQIDKNVMLSQMYHGHPEVEQELDKIKSSYVWTRAFGGMIAERGIYGLGGFALRSGTVSILGVLTAPVTAGIMGTFMARRRAIQELHEEAQLRTAGGEGNLTKKIDYKVPLHDEKGKVMGTQDLRVGDEKLPKDKERKKSTSLLNVIRADRLAEKLKQAVASGERWDSAHEKEWQVSRKKKGGTHKSEPTTKMGGLEARILYTMTKLESGLIDFGSTPEERLKNYDALAQALSEASILSIGPEARVSETMKRLEEFMGGKEKAIKSHVRRRMVRGALMGALAAEVGYEVRSLLGSWIGHHVHSGLAGPDKMSIPEGILLKDKLRLIRQVELDNDRPFIGKDGFIHSKSFKGIYDVVNGKVIFRGQDTEGDMRLWTLGKNGETHILRPAEVIAPATAVVQQEPTPIPTRPSAPAGDLEQKPPESITPKATRTPSSTAAVEKKPTGEPASASKQIPPIEATPTPAPAQGKGEAISEAGTEKEPDAVLGTAALEAEAINETPYRATIGEKSNVWTAAHELVKEGKITQKEFEEAWANPQSAAQVEGQVNIPIARVSLVHKGDEVRYIAGVKGEQGYFVVLNKSEVRLGSDSDLLQYYQKKQIEIPRFLKESVESEQVARPLPKSSMTFYDWTTISPKPKGEIIRESVFAPDLVQWAHEKNLTISPIFQEHLIEAGYTENLPMVARCIEDENMRFGDLTLLAQEERMQSLESLVEDAKHFADDYQATDYRLLGIDIQQNVEEMRETMRDTHGQFLQSLKKMGVRPVEWNKVLKTKIKVGELLARNEVRSLPQGFEKVITYIKSMSPKANERSITLDAYLKQRFVHAGFAKPRSS